MRTLNMVFIQQACISQVIAAFIGQIAGFHAAGQEEHKQQYCGHGTSPKRQKGMSCDIQALSTPTLRTMLHHLFVMMFLHVCACCPCAHQCPSGTGKTLPDLPAQNSRMGSDKALPLHVPAPRQHSSESTEVHLPACPR